MMDLRQVRYFIRIAELGSFSKASQHLNVAQPALSRHVQALEAELGVELLSRTTRGVTVTEAGHILIAQGSNLLRCAVDLKDAIRKATSTPCGAVTLGMPPSISGMVAQHLVEECQAHLPDVRLTVVEGLSIFLEEWLDQGNLDFAIVTDRPSAQRFETSMLFEEDFVVVGCLDAIPPLQTGIRLDELKTLDLVMTRGFRSIVTEQLGVDALRCRAEVDSLSAIVDMLVEGRTATVLPQGIVRKQGLARNFRIMPFSDTVPRRSLIIATNPRRPTSVATKAVRTIVMSRLRPRQAGRVAAVRSPARLAVR